ncbi:MAG: nitrate reductase molybdenum cofactor assembly chaperone, partial [Bacillales bacterium]
MEEYRLVFKLCSLLFEYPQEEWQKDDLQQTLCLIKDKNVKEELAAFLGYLESTPFETVCEYYVHQFDFRAETSLYLTYGIFGDNMERGSALVKLKMEFAKAGFFVKGKELPDYLPMILEFAAIAEINSVRKLFQIHQ